MQKESFGGDYLIDKKKPELRCNAFVLFYRRKNFIYRQNHSLLEMTNSTKKMLVGLLGE